MQERTQQAATALYDELDLGLWMLLTTGTSPRGDKSTVLNGLRLRLWEHGLELADSADAPTLHKRIVRVVGGLDARRLPEGAERVELRGEVDAILDDLAELGGFPPEHRTWSNSR